MDYLKLISKARTPSLLAMYVRAFGCATASGLSNAYPPAEIVSIVRSYEATAQSLERCETTPDGIKLARKIVHNFLSR